MWVKLTSLTAVCAIGVLYGSWAYAAVNVADDVTAKPMENKGEMIVAQAWWDAAWAAAIAQQQAVTALARHEYYSAIASPIVDLR